MKRVIKTSAQTEKHRKKFLKRGRTIQTVYYLGKNPVKITRSTYSFSAVPRCIAHMQINQYGANIAEVFDLHDGKLHAVIRRLISGEIRIIFKREVKEGV